MARRGRALGALACALVLAAAVAPPSAQELAAPRYAIAEILASIRHVESGGTPHGGRGARGDGGRALGPYQIHRAYWVDSRVAGSYEDCAEPEYARRVVLAYWRRWCPDALDRRDAEVLARVHNGGPDGASQRATLAYWQKVRRRLDGASAVTPAGARGAVLRAAP